MKKKTKKFINKRQAAISMRVDACWGFTAYKRNKTVRGFSLDGVSGTGNKLDFLIGLLCVR